MSSLINISPSEQAWDAHRSELEELYVEKNKSVREIRSYMTEKYNFNASPHHYNKHLNTQWKCVKKGSSISWKVALPHVLRINRGGKEAQVLIGGKLKTPQEVCNAMVRYRKLIRAGDTVEDMPTLPSDVIVRAVVQPTTVTIPPQLPFHMMERVLALRLRSHTDPGVQVLSRNDSSNEIPGTIMPPELSESSLMNATTRSFASPLHRSLLYSIANNFTGLVDMPKADILRILKQETTRGLFLALADAPKLYAVQALARGLFRAALEAGDTETVVFVLKQLPSLVNEAIWIRQSDWRSQKSPIQLASAFGHADVVRALINAGANLKGLLRYLSSRCFKDLQGLRESFLAAGLTGEVEKMKSLLVTAGDDFGLTCAELLSSYGWAIPKIIEAKQPMAASILIEAGGFQAEYYSMDRQGITSLAAAMRYEQFSLIRVLLDNGADPDVSGYEVKDDSGKLPKYYSSYKGLLSVAIKDGRDEMIQDLLDAGANVNKGFPRPLAVAMQCHRLDVARTLISHGADINEMKHNLTPLRCAIETPDAGLVQFALEHGADPHDQDAINSAFKKGHDLFSALMREHRRRYKRGRKGWEPLVLRRCIDANNLDMFKDLVFTLMADVHYPERDHEGSSKLTSFGYAIFKSKQTGPEILEFLMQNKDKLNCSPNTLVTLSPKETALSAAVNTNHLPTVQLLLKHGFRANESRNMGERRTPLQNAVENGRTEIIQMLLDHGMSVNEPAAHNDGATALQLASIEGYFPIAKLLLENGAEVDAPGATLNGVTALEGAALYGRLDMVALLLGVGAADQGKDMGQLKRAIRYAREEGHVMVRKLLEGFVETGVIPETTGFYSNFVDLDNEDLTDNDLDKDDDDLDDEDCWNIRSRDWMVTDH
ncbi:hypothetical protein PG985_016143 [Apiospora marii]|uniref:uncharacterized protein n=1 Tax=Apiospora marii TaxID=335849 RepID=UPI0031323523